MRRTEPELTTAANHRYRCQCGRFYEWTPSDSATDSNRLIQINYVFDTTGTAHQETMKGPGYRPRNHPCHFPVAALGEPGGGCLMCKEWKQNGYGKWRPYAMRFSDYRHKTAAAAQQEYWQ
jgi:hypothetical protein